MAVLFANNATGRLASSVSLAQTTISLQSGQGARFPSPSGGDWFPITAIKASGAVEIMRCTARTGDVLTVARAQEATVALEWSPGDRVELRVTRNALEWSMVPKGGIIMWSGALASIPQGWALCNGANGTPDLRNRFIVGAGSTYSVGNTGGTDSVTLTAAQMPTHNHSASTAAAGAHSHGGSTGANGGHGHTASSGAAGAHSHTATTSSAGAHSHTASTGSAGSHSHSIASRTGDFTSGSVANRATLGSTTTSLSIDSAGAHSHTVSINSNGAHTHTLTTTTQADHTHSVSVGTVENHSHTISSDGGHTHTMTVGNAGSGNSHENRPPYYALAYIMKL
jgi:microcystin-dependent protein